ncbi:unnamed protein product, partial [Nesidiocoris tenuis]
MVSCLFLKKKKAFDSKERVSKKINTSLAHGTYVKRDLRSRKSKTYTRELRSAAAFITLTFTAINC